MGDLPVPELVVGSDRVDLRHALTQLASRTGARAVRVDSGGQLTRALLDLRLVDEVSLLVHSCLTDAEISSLVRRGPAARSDDGATGCRDLRSWARLAALPRWAAAAGASRLGGVTRHHPGRTFSPPRPAESLREDRLEQFREPRGSIYEKP